MSLVLADRVRETTQTTGTGTITLDGAVQGFQSFSVIGNNNTTYYTINRGAEWEVGIGTYYGATLSRDTVLDSSNSKSKVNFSAGSKDVFVTLPSEKLVITVAGRTGDVVLTNTDISGLGTISTQNANAVAITGGSVNSTTIGSTTPSSGAFTFASTNNSTSTTPALGYNASNASFVNGATVAGSYLQNVMQNKSGTAGASTNFAVSNDLGTDSTYYGEFGMNSSVYSSGTPADFFSINNGIYFSGHDGDVTLGSGNGYKTYLAWGTTGQSAHVINTTGAIGLNTNITGTTNFGTSGQMMLSAGSGATPTWSNAPTITGGTIDNATIGVSTASTGKFTTLTSTGTATLANGSTTYVQAIGDASYPGVYAAGGTNTPLVLQPLGTGALQAQKTDSTATGGSARGANAVDWQTSRGTASQVASGSYSVLTGGLNNYSLTYTSFVGSGSTNSAQTNSFTSIVAGNSNTASGLYGAIVNGYLNVASGYFSFIGNGQSNSTPSVSAVTTQSATMNGTTAVTLSGSNASIKVGQLITGTSIASYTYVAAISGTSLTLSQAASGSSTSTLSFYTPHGVVVGGGNNQATGSYSFIGGGGDAGTAANRNVASGDWSVVGGGVKNVVSGAGSVIVGGGYNGSGGINGNTVSGIGSFVGTGYACTVAGGNSAIVAGYSSFASGNFSFVGTGTNGTTRGITGYHAFPASQNPFGSPVGASQTAFLVLGVETTDATATILRSNQSAASGTNQVILPNNSAYYFRGEVVAGKTGAGDTKGWSIEGVIKRGANAASTAIVGTATVTSLYADAGAATWALTATADTTNGGLAITFTGQASTTIRTVCQVRTTEMTF